MAVILLSTALLKAHQAATDPLTETHPLSGRSFLVALVWFEVLLAFWMLTGLHRRTTRWVVIACFVTFATVSLALALNGAESCGCFGRIHVSPWFAFALDAAVALGIWLAPGSRSPSLTVLHAPGRFIAAAVGSVVLGSLLTHAMMAHPDPAGQGSKGFTPEHRLPIVVLKPETWPGKLLPILSHVEFRSSPVNIMQGNWQVVVYRDGCSHCRELVPKLWARAVDDPGKRIAFIEVPPHASGAPSLVTDSMRDSDRVALARLSTAHEWFVQTPTVIELEQGIVRRVSHRFEE